MKENELTVNIEKLREDQRKNFADRLEFIRWYANWLKKTPNSVWSKAQNKVVEQYSH